MSALAALNRAYVRMADRNEAPPYGYSSERIGFLILLNPDGSPAGVPTDLRDGAGKKQAAPLIAVPRPEKRTSGVSPNFLWDKTSYALGVTAGEGKRLSVEHAAFRDRHLALLADANDPGLVALARFIEAWTPDQFEALAWPDEMKDQNLVFALASEYRERNLHDRPAARDLWATQLAGGQPSEAVCLITGRRGPIARLHPSIKGVWGAQTAGASIVSFNLDAFTSYGHEQGENAPVSEAAAFGYAAALNRFLERGSGHRLQIGDASTVYWADASEAERRREAVSVFGHALGIDENKQAGSVRTVLEKVAAGRPMAEIRPELTDGVRFYVLGLAPNAARLSVRFWIEDDFEAIALRLLRHFDALRLDPPPKNETPSLWRCLIETAAQGKTENIPPQLAGDMLRAILTGAPYPQTLAAALLMRLRADRDVNALRVALLKAVLIRNHPKMETPVSLDLSNADPGYLLGRLFAAYEYAQVQALGGKVNATIRDQFYGTASATPRSVFPALQRKAVHHLARLRKDAMNRAAYLDKTIGEIFELSEPDQLFVATLSLQRQAMFAIGYYHQRNKFYAGKESAADSPTSQSEESGQ